MDIIVGYRNYESDIGLLKKAAWYYPRGIKNIQWRKKYFYKYSDYLWGDDLLYSDIPTMDIICHLLNPPPISAKLFQNEKW